MAMWGIPRKKEENQQIPASCLHLTHASNVSISSLKTKATQLQIPIVFDINI